MSHTIGDLVELPAVRTVIQLSDARKHAADIAESFVFTSDVYAHVSALAEILGRETGRGMFIQGEFGSGKSHFLAALASWLEQRDGSQALTQAHSSLQRLAEHARRILPVEISLVAYRGSTSLEQIIVQAIEAALLDRGHTARLTPLATFFAELQRILEAADASAAFAELAKCEVAGLATYCQADPHQAYALALRFLRDHGLDHPETLVEDRAQTFDRVTQALRAAGYDGMILIIDELSEFFRSKPSPAKLNEDARLLQFLGERAAETPLWIIAAIQESIERTGDIAQATFRKIKDRFPIRFQLSTVHIRDLIAQRLVRRRPGSEDALVAVHAQLRQNFPSFATPFDEFVRLYPVHPLTLRLLEGLGDLFSQHRGIVDFVRAQVAGDSERGIRGILNRPSGELLAPDAIYDHFVPRLAEFSSFHIYPRHIVPHLDDVAGEQLAPEDATLAKRLLRMLVLFTIHPTSEPPTVSVLAELAACMLAPHSPQLNAEFVAEAVLQPIADHSGFLQREGDRFVIVTETDHSSTWQARVKRAAQDLSTDDSRLVGNALPELPASPSWPGPELNCGPVARTVQWQRSERTCVVLLRTDDEDPVTAEIVADLANGRYDCGVVVDFRGTYAPTVGAGPQAAGEIAVWRVQVSEAQTPSLREYAATRELASALRPGNPADLPLIPLAQRDCQRLLPQVQQILLEAIYAGQFQDAQLVVDDGIRTIRGFDRLLETAAGVLLERRFPSFRQIAPRSVPAAERHYDRLLHDLIGPASLSLTQARKQGLQELIESLVVPLGLVDVRNGSYRVSPDPVANPLLGAAFAAVSASRSTPLPDFLRELELGPFGLPPATARFLTVALAHAGLLSVLRGGRVLPIEFLHLRSLEEAHEVAPGELIAAADRETLLQDCRFLADGDDWGTFGLRQQRDAWQAVQRHRERWQKQLEAIQTGLQHLREFPVFHGLAEAAWRPALDAIATVSDEVKVSYGAREGLERFLLAWRRAGLTGSSVGLLGRLQTFCEQRYEAVLFASHFCEHASVQAAAGQNEAFAERLAALRGQLADIGTLAVSEDAGAFQQALEALRQHYAVLYEQAHRAHYRQADVPPLSQNGQRVLATLQRLASLQALDRPPGLSDLLQKLTRPEVQPCRRPLAQELHRNPTCSCGFQMGDAPLTAPIENAEEQLDKALAKYAEILSAPAVREALSSRIYALSDTPGESRALAELGYCLRDEPAPPAVLIRALSQETVCELDQALRNRLQVEPRSLDVLVQALAGRRLAPAAIRAELENWLGRVDETCILTLEHDPALSKESPGTVGWWPWLHAPYLPTAADFAQAKQWQRALEQQFPVVDLLRTFQSLETDALLQFVYREPLHLQALQVAWRALCERVLTGEPMPEETQPPQVLEGAEGLAARLAALRDLAAIRLRPFPERLIARLAISALLSDPWTSRDLRRLLERELHDLEVAATTWAESLPVHLGTGAGASKPDILLIIDAVPVDVWLAIADLLPGEICISRLPGVTTTLAGLGHRLGTDQDPTEFCATQGIAYHSIPGGEAHSLSDLLPDWQSAEKSLGAQPRALVRIGCFDQAVHSGSMPLHAFPEALRALFERQIRPWLAESATAGIRIQIGNDHGCALTPDGLHHGGQTIYERLLVTCA